MNASDLIKILPKPTCEERAVHIWHLDEVYLKIDGRMVYLWRAVDAEGEVLDVLVQTMLIGMLDKRLSMCYRLEHGHNLPNKPS
jgi:hypothetical protein